MIDSFERFVNQLEQEQIPFRRVGDENIVSIPTRLVDESAVLHIRWELEPGIIQFVQPLPLFVPEPGRAGMATVLHRINHSLAVMGFTLDEQTGLVSFRTQAFLDARGAISIGLIGALITTCVRSAVLVLPVLRETLGGVVK